MNEETLLRKWSIRKAQADSAPRGCLIPVASEMTGFREGDLTQKGLAELEGVQTAYSM